ncbi:hypothetical protein LR004_03155 [Candidatus Gracilibacteria bacterium]|nr:hypothetical protein [Candidatus Gracilibacteria bacterium]
MKTHYITIFSEESYKTITDIENVTSELGAVILQSGIALDSAGLYHIIMEVEAEEDMDIAILISGISSLNDVVEVRDMEESKKEVKFIFNVNCNCKKTLKKISKKPERIVETDKELIYVYVVKLKKRDLFLQELSNLQLPYTQRMIGITSHH